MSTKKAPNDVDRQVGTRVRMRRTLIGMSQEKLGEALGLTFQQVQKYEKGTNRISASRLHQIATALGVTINYLYGGNDLPDTPESGFAEAPVPYEGEMLTSDALKLLRAFHRIADPRMRRKVIEIATVLAAPGDEEADDRSA
ncbi:helix-turn-helix transcriptional regulator [Enterovirga sp.]|uniref:helix-turn-helix domain-containing protein n=1 Tax=Enterovirga sp. TaxID=2026350 RepID=UPI002CFFF779|nr:helix-turn-helix transcriptional regulator [Enterovirga sp.]HMO29525.1 helix-turn-helix transcriptional regulator [Enterovirga sp.]